MGMKVAAVSVLCQDRRVYDAMEMAGTLVHTWGRLGTKHLIVGKLILIAYLLSLKETKKDVQTRNAAVAGGVSVLALLLLLL